MKKLILLITFSCIINLGNIKAQKNEDCMQNLSIFVESAKVKNYDMAFD